jgi:hypothetical protein
LDDENKEALSSEIILLQKKNEVGYRTSYTSGGQTTYLSVKMRGVKNYTVDSPCLPCPPSPPLPAAGAASWIRLRGLEGKKSSVWKWLETVLLTRQIGNFRVSSIKYREKS